MAKLKHGEKCQPSKGEVARNRTRVVLRDCPFCTVVLFLQQEIRALMFVRFFVCGSLGFGSISTGSQHVFAFFFCLSPNFLFSSFLSSFVILNSDVDRVLELLNFGGFDGGAFV